MKPSPVLPPDMEVNRKRAKRTALLFAGIALAIYVAFILSGVLGR